MWMRSICVGNARAPAKESHIVAAWHVGVMAAWHVGVIDVMNRFG